MKMGSSSAQRTSYHCHQPPNRHTRINSSSSSSEPLTSLLLSTPTASSTIESLKPSIHGDDCSSTADVTRSTLTEAATIATMIDTSSSTSTTTTTTDTNNNVKSSRKRRYNKKGNNGGSKAFSSSNSRHTSCKWSRILIVALCQMASVLSQGMYKIM